jgi:hypothetical protein
MFDDDDYGVVFVPVLSAESSDADRERLIADQTELCLAAFRLTLEDDPDLSDTERAAILARVTPFIRRQTRNVFERGHARLRGTDPPPVCRICARPFTVDGCITQPAVLPYGHEGLFDAPNGAAHPDPPPQCRDCGVRLGAAHHAECGVARCAQCGGQWLGGCACRDRPRRPGLDGHARVH